MYEYACKCLSWEPLTEIHYYSSGIRYARCSECGKWWECYSPTSLDATHMTAAEAMSKINAPQEIAEITWFHARMGYPTEWLDVLNWVLAQPAGTKLETSHGTLETTGTMVVLTGRDAPNDWLLLKSIVFKQDFQSSVRAAMVRAEQDQRK